MSGKQVHSGFSLVELLAIILLIAIISALVIPRFNEPDVFAELAAQDALVTGIRRAQQAALGRQTVSFRIASTTSEWQFIVQAGAQQLAVSTVQRRGVQLQTGSAETPPVATDSCASGTRFDAAVQGFKLDFDSQGDISAFHYDGISPDPQQNIPSFNFNGVRICLNDKVAASVCVSPSGYAYEGDCER